MTRMEEMAYARRSNAIRAAANWISIGILITSLGLLAVAPAGASQPPSVNLTADLSAWVTEQTTGGSVTSKDGALVIEDAAGCTVWFREQVSAPLELSYDVTVISRGGPHDRVSDLNCFWMATDPRLTDERPFTPGHGRSGKFEEYDNLRTYYVGMGGNENTTTRFRRYAGDGTKPLLPAHDLGDKKFLLEPNRTYRIRVIARDGTAEFWRDGERVFAFKDPEPLKTGWFGFRTVHSHLEIRNFQVTQAARGAAMTKPH